MKTKIEKLRDALKRAAEVAAALETQLALEVASEEARVKKQKRERNCRIAARRTARQNGIEVDDEVVDFDRISVWPPESLQGDDKDPFDGDHYVYNWEDALERVNAYAKLLATNKAFRQ